MGKVLRACSHPQIDERVTIETYAQNPDPVEIDVKSDPALRIGITGDIIRVIKAPDVDAVKAQLEELWSKGFRSLALALVHSYTFTDHESLLARLAKDRGFQVTVSHELQPMVSLIARF